MNQNLIINDGHYSIKLFFIFHILDGIKSLDENPIYELHFRCLKYFKNAFSKCVFIITVDDLNNPLIKTTIERISIIFNNVDIQFIIEKNDKLQREGIYFNKYVLQHLDSICGENELLFFGHSKGIYNYTQNLNVTLWVASMYYFICNFIEEYSGLLKTGKKLCYGFPCSNIKMHPDDKLFTWQYSGSFHVINPKVLYKYIIDNDIKLNKYEDDPLYNYIRFIAERYLGLIIDNKNEDLIGYFKDDILKMINRNINYYNHTNYDKYLQNYLPYNYYNKFISFYNEITLDL